MRMSTEELLEKGLVALGLESGVELFAKLAVYIAEIERLNPSLGLVGASGDELVVKHILDSLAPIGIIRGLLGQRETPRIADLGSGAGLPGVPLALAMPDAEVALIDRMTRRTDFLRSLLELLPLPNAEVIEAQVEQVRGNYDLVAFRAFRPFEPKLFKRIFSLCGPEGAVIAYKGKAEKARAELAEIAGMYSSAEIVPISVPFLPDERCVVVMRRERAP